MIDNKTVIISCAGMGKRLGLETTKALVSVCGKPLIVRTLELLKDVKDVRIAVGFQAEKVIELVNQYRKDVTYVFNHNYTTTGTAGSVSLALDGAKEYILTIDGDLIIHPEDMQKILEHDGEFACGCDIDSEDPVMMSVNDGMVTSFSREVGDYEWTGITCLTTKRIIKSDKHVYQMVEPLLPIPFLKIRTKEIDTMNDYYNAEKWINNNFSDKVVLGLIGGMGSYATLHVFEQYLEKFPAEKEWERPRIIIDNNCTMPSRVRAILYNENKDQLMRELNLSLKNLITSGATDVLFACNTSHVFVDEILKNSPGLKNKVHHIINDSAEYCNTNNIKEVYLLASEGTVQTKIYDKTFNNFNINVVSDEKDFDIVRRFIEVVKQNKITDKDMNDFVKFVNGLKDEVVLLGCTELPVLYSKVKDQITKKIINPIDISLDNIYRKFNGM